MIFVLGPVAKDRLVLRRNDAMSLLLLPSANHTWRDNSPFNIIYSNDVPIFKTGQKITARLSQWLEEIPVSWRNGDLWTSQLGLPKSWGSQIIQVIRPLKHIETHPKLESLGDLKL